MLKKEIILVNPQNRPIGLGEKMEVHRSGKLHRAFSILIFNNKDELLLQQRSEFKPIAPYLWSNTCCSHPRPGGDIKKEAEKRLKQEMGFSTALKEVFRLRYKVRYGLLTENEIDYVFLGQYNSNPRPNRKEALGFKWANLKWLQKDIAENPEKYTFWLKLILQNAKLRENSALCD